MTISVDLPEDLARAVAAEGETVDRGVIAALVFYAYARGRLSAGKAAEILGVNRDQFDVLREEREIAAPFDEGDLESDLKWARSHT